MCGKKKRENFLYYLYGDETVRNSAERMQVYRSHGIMHEEEKYIGKI
jgi:hypothetical protein